MIRLSDISIRARLRSLVGISTVGFALLLGLSAWVLQRYRIEGPVHEKLQHIESLRAELAPTVITILRPHLIVEGLIGKTDPVAIDRWQAVLATMERDYRDSYAGWKESALPPEIRKSLADCDELADQGNRTLTCCQANDLREEVDIPAGHATFHGDAFFVGVLL